MIHSKFELEYTFNKIQIKIHEANIEDVQLFYFISGNKEDEKSNAVEELKNNLIELCKVLKEEQNAKLQN